ncbi:hypothetical protein [Thioalkalivibrio thiocyanodenitrificans]|uniref:hypothetical protein n=1 Tax=Thioalkalivibrio thiocyanodenitrificans TaxID=243063 RepID=UPI00035C1AE9|nr:hypothetical protein [Thioalkalivibrio thiocyanodenitrificans]
MQGTGINFSYTVPGSGQAPPPLLILDGLRLSDAGPHSMLLRTTDGSVATLLARPLARGLEVCRRFATLDQHADLLARRLGASDRAEVRRSLEALHGRGHFIDASAFLSRLDAGADVPASSPLPVYVRTCGRPDDLVRLLDALHGACAAGQTVAVIDDSADTDTERANQDACRAAAARGLDVGYAGRHGLDPVLSEVAGDDPDDAAILRWLLAPERGPGEGSYGAALNRVLLLSAGRRALLLDDDAALTPLRPAHVTPGPLSLSSRPYDNRYYPADHPHDECRALPLSAFEEHARLLGQGVGAVLANETPEARLTALRETEPGLPDRLNAHAAVKLSVNGVVGDSGAPSNLQLFLTAPENLGPALASEARYEALVTGHTVWRGRAGLNLSPVCILTLTTLAGVDNRTLVPPVLPLGRGEDYLFGAALEFLYPEMFVAELPWSLLHSPGRGRRYDRGLFDRPVTPGGSQILAEAIRAEAPRCRARAPEARLAHLGELVSGWARLDDDALGAMFEELVVASRSALLGRLDESLRRHADSPEFVRADLRKLIERNNDFRPETLRPARLDDLRLAWGRYGRALALWPRLWARLRVQGAGDRVLSRG